MTNQDAIDELLDYSNEGEFGPRETNTKTEEVKKYDFVIQMAWIPRTPMERYEAKIKREEEQAKKDEAAAKAAADQAAAANNNG